MKQHVSYHSHSFTLMFKQIRKYVSLLEQSMLPRTAISVILNIFRIVIPSSLHPVSCQVVVGDNLSPQPSILCIVFLQIISLYPISTSVFFKKSYSMEQLQSFSLMQQSQSFCNQMLSQAFLPFKKQLHGRS